VTPDRAIVATVDFSRPSSMTRTTSAASPAANAFSDVYAMGGTPLLALNLVGWPRDTLPYELLGEVLRGAPTRQRSGRLRARWALGGRSRAQIRHGRHRRGASQSHS